MSLRLSVMWNQAPAEHGMCCTQAALATSAFEAVCKLYDRIEAAIQDPYKGAGDSFEQRWLV